MKNTLKLLIFCFIMVGLFSASNVQGETKKMNKKFSSALIVYYSMTGNTEKIANIISSDLNCDIEELVENKERKGILTSIKASWDIFRKKSTTLKKLNKDISKYDLVIIGTPVWWYKSSIPVRAFCMENKGKLKKVAFFSTADGSEKNKQFEEMSGILGLSPVTTLDIWGKDFKNQDYKKKTEVFVNKLK